MEEGIYKVTQYSHGKEKYVGVLKEKSSTAVVSLKKEGGMFIHDKRSISCIFLKPLDKITVQNICEHFGGLEFKKIAGLEKLL